MNWWVSRFALTWAGADPVLTLACVAQVDVMKEAYTQGLQSEEEDDGVGDQIKPRDVGHNIYILAHQVREETAEFVNGRHQMQKWQPVGVIKYTVDLFF